VSRKRALVTFAALGLGTGCLLLIATTSLAALVLAQGIIAIAAIVMPQAITAISVGLVGYRAFALRMGRNEVYSHAGAVAAAIVAGSIAYWIATIGLFYFAAAMSVAASIAAMSIREEEIDPALAREAEVKSEGKLAITSIRDLMRDSRITIFTVAVVLFHLANAAMLPLAGEMLSARRPTLLGRLNNLLSWMVAAFGQEQLAPVKLCYGRTNVRVIGGQERGRKLTAPRGKDTRPATARVRASVFSRLASRNAIAGAYVLDIFAGSGSFGLEALSRGASHVTFVDRARAAAAAIAINLSKLHMADRARIITAEFRRALAELAESGECFGVVFVDAPFGADSTTEVLALIATLGLLAPDGLLVTRQFHRTPAPVAAALECVNVAKIGDHRIALYRRLQSGEASEEARTSPTGGECLPCDAGMSGKDQHGE